MILPARSVRLDPPREPAPDWWEAEFHRRQSRLRSRLPGLIAGYPGGASRQQMRQRLGSWSTAEVDHALDALEAAGAIVGERRTEPYSHHDARPVERIYYRPATPESIS